MADIVKPSAQKCAVCGLEGTGNFCLRDGAPLRPPEQEALVGQVLHETYRIISLLGIGGMGAVYKAVHLHLDTTVAVKVISITPNWDESELFPRFRREAKMINSLIHPGIVRALDFGVHNGKPYLVMDYVEGESLEAILGKLKRLEPRKAVAIFRQICDALSYAHSNGVLHRDLKPGNIMLVPAEGGKDTVRLLDFGLAKLINQGDSGAEKLTETGAFLGTPHYMSPEQCLGKITQLDGRTDIYSLGCIMYEALTGKTPIDGGNSLEVLHNQIGEMPRRFSDLGIGGVSADLEAVVLKAIQKSPDERQSSMAELQRELEKALRPSLLGVSASEPAAARSHRLPVAWAGGLIAAVLLGAAAVAICSGLWHSWKAQSGAPPAVPGESEAVRTLAPSSFAGGRSTTPQEAAQLEPGAAGGNATGGRSAAPKNARVKPEMAAGNNASGGRSSAPKNARVKPEMAAGNNASGGRSAAPGNARVKPEMAAGNNASGRTIEAAPEESRTASRPLAANAAAGAGAKPESLPKAALRSEPPRVELNSADQTSADQLITSALPGGTGFHRAAAAMPESTLSGDRAEQVTQLEERAQSLYDKKNREEGDNLIQRAIAIRKAAGSSADIVDDILKLCETAYTKQDDNAMQRYCAEADRILAAAGVSRKDQRYGDVDNYRGWALFQQKNYSQAESAFTNASNVHKQGGEEKNNWLLSDLRGLRRSLQSEHKYDQVVKYTQQSLQYVRPGTREEGWLHFNYGDASRQLKDYATADGELSKAGNLFYANHDWNDYARILGAIAVSKRDQGDFSTAAKLFQEQAEWWARLHKTKSENEALDHARHAADAARRQAND